MTLQEQIDDMATEGPEQTEEQTDDMATDSAMTLQEQIDDMATEGPEQTEEQTDEDQRSSTPPSDDMDRILAGISDDIDEWHQ